MVRHLMDQRKGCSEELVQRCVDCHDGPIGAKAIMQDPVRVAALTARDHDDTDQLAQIGQANQVPEVIEAPLPLPPPPPEPTGRAAEPVPPEQACQEPPVRAEDHRKSSAK
eukprot:1453825-Alexandrium_andersonii.AAC.1